MPGVRVPPGFTRDPGPNADAPKPAKSVHGLLNDGKPYAFPGLNDYVQALVNAGHVADLDDLRCNYANLINEIFFNWMATGQLACIFAVKLSKTPRESRWFPIVQLGALAENGQLASTLNVQLDAAASEGQEAAVVIFPEITDDDHIVSLVNNLCSDPNGRWYVTDAGIDPDPNGKLHMIGLRWILGSGKSVNFVLGFSPSPMMPLTRRSPFTALFLRIRDDKRTPSHTENGLVQVHLADLDSTYSPQSLHDQIWEITQRQRANYVEPEMTVAARAKVTLSVCMEAGRRLCDLRPVVVEKDVNADGK